ncbi:dTDP-4-dehydrorhamnose reductase [Oharaeibacter diazotrophicus]|uniref:dTDP-4-dehydrorhamnose reductase n=1 Tax=Oharaeibacter diazotrophicus TaxID=1920512 RepID=A0A4R6RBF3_9HYPH|nr:dTDP-4-dehydrorhamnose reductase [Oharaeibacter diazotrophicus]TDP83315.1 dTDP-4-dehydrorhamnose reductase [Oharaeibacter diazotrophicus]BBE72149.1 dTDP-4-dehydrorhamnose reductase [Pleomorphomonas sp. SM30]GLS78915.1 NAD(P)-dependent oxidoreductase [Oharaeibacter diazotrophicus]
MRLLVTGREGQVVTALKEIGPAAGHEIVALGRPDLDLADAASVAAAVERVRPDAVISAAAYTAVDKAETEPDVALAVNATGPGALAAAAARLGIPVVHLSTDYVFDGTKPTPYVETDPVGPRSVYGSTKLEGERAVLAAQPRSAVLRTAWVYAPFGANFVRTMLRLSETMDVVRVVADQRGTPTSAHDIAAAVVAVAGNLVARADDAALAGVFHMTGAGEATWADFAEAVFAGAARRGGKAPRVERITTAEFPRPAPRPANSRLDCGKLARTHGVTLPDWRVSLDAVLDRLLA